MVCWIDSWQMGALLLCFGEPASVFLNRFHKSLKTGQDSLVIWSSSCVSRLKDDTSAGYLTVRKTEEYLKTCGRKAISESTTWETFRGNSCVVWVGGGCVETGFQCLGSFGQPRGFRQWGSRQHVLCQFSDGCCASWVYQWNNSHVKLGWKFLPWQKKMTRSRCSWQQRTSIDPSWNTDQGV